MPVSIVDYHRPKSLKEALGLLASLGSKGMAVGGGLSLALTGQHRPVHAVDLSVHGLESIELKDHVLRIGSMATLTDVLESPLVADICGGIIPQALRTAGTLPLRNQISVGGNVVQCYYWSTMPPLLLALDGRLVLAANRGTRTVTAADFFSTHPLRFLGPGEIVQRIEIPTQPKLPRSAKGGITPARGLRWGGAFLKCATTSNDYGLVNACAVLATAGKRVVSCRLVLGAVHTLPIRCTAAEESITGNTLADISELDAAELAVEHIKIRGDARFSKEYHRRMAAVYLRRALTLAKETLSSC